jgi:pimeloyl-ACP methyl ester carboxylesterase
MTTAAPAPTPTTSRRRLRTWLALGVGAAVLTVAVVFGLRLHGAFSLLNSGERVDLDGRLAFVHCRGSGSPTIVLEHGLGSSGVEWRAVQDELAGANRVCWRSRAGMGFSDPIPQGQTQTAGQAANDLSRVLAAADVPGPYLLVGHSFGGHVVRLFADQRPDEVVGVVLVDSTHEDQVDLLRQHLSPGAWAEVSGLFGTDNPERMDFAASAGEVAQAGDLADLPLVVLEATVQQSDAEGAGISPATAAEIDRVMAERWPDLQSDLARLSTTSRHAAVEGSGHFIQNDDPQAVVDAVHWTLRPEHWALQPEHWILQPEHWVVDR